MRLKHLALLAFMASVCAGCGSDTAVVLECPSPDGSTVAILYSHAGGGAAGWFFYQLALQPAVLPPTLPKRFGGGPSVEVLRVDEVQAMTLDWKSDQHLTVESSIDGLTTVFHMFHQYP